jgi:hypothetical protein
VVNWSRFADAGNPIELIAVDLGAGKLRFITGWHL